MSAPDVKLGKGDILGSIAIGTLKGIANTIAPRTTSMISQTKRLFKELDPDKEKKRASDLFDRDIS